MTLKLSFLKSKILTDNRRITPLNTKHNFLHVSAYAAQLIVTHPLIPSQEGKQIHSNLSFPNRKAASKSPRPKEGQGVCDAQALPLKSKAVTEAD